MKISDWLVDFFALRPLCGPVLFRSAWFLFLAVEAIGLVAMTIGTLEVYPTSSGVPLAVLTQVPWTLVRVLLVRIFLEMATKVLASGR